MSIIARQRASGVIDIIRAEHVHLPHVDVRVFSGGLGHLATIPVLPGETAEAAADREARGAERGAPSPVEWV